MLNAKVMNTSRYTRCRKGREDEITRSDLTLNSTPDHVLADFLSDLLLHLVNLLVFLVDLVLHLVHLPVLHLVQLLYNLTSATSNGFPTALMNTFVFTASSSNSYSS